MLQYNIISVHALHGLLTSNLIISGTQLLRCLRSSLGPRRQKQGAEPGQIENKKRREISNNILAVANMQDLFSSEILSLYRNSLRRHFGYSTRVRIFAADTNLYAVQIV
jgi:hypothetical protein